jgi:hypothetical protein
VVGLLLGVGGVWGRRGAPVGLRRLLLLSVGVVRRSIRRRWPLLLLLLLLRLLALTLRLGWVVVVGTLLLRVRVNGRRGALLMVPSSLLLLQGRVILLPLQRVIPRCFTRSGSSSGLGVVTALLGILLTLLLLVVSLLLLLLGSTRSRVAVRIAPAVDSLLTLLHLQLLLVLALSGILLLVILGRLRLFLVEVGLERLNLFEVLVSLLRHLGKGFRL